MEYQLILIGVLVVALLYSFYASSRKTSPITDLIGSNSLGFKLNTYDYSLLKKWRESQEQFKPVVQHMMPVSVDNGYDIVGYNY